MKELDAYKSTLLRNMEELPEGTEEREAERQLGAWNFQVIEAVKKHD